MEQDKYSYIDIDHKFKICIAREDVGYVIDILDFRGNLMDTLTIWDDELRKDDVDE